MLLVTAWGCSDEIRNEGGGVPTFTITLSDAEHGSAVAMLNGREVTEAEAGDVVSVTATPESEEWRFTSWSHTPSDVAFASPKSPRTTFIMPAGDVVITPEFVEAVFISEGGDLGRVTFFSAEQWDTEELVWSDMVMATRCRKDGFDGGPEGPYKVDCRQSEGFGDLFTWEAVNQHADELCPEGWRLPTKKDFFDLDAALGGGGSGGGDPREYSKVWSKYLDEWGAQPSGYARTANPDIVFPGAVACYWSQTEMDADRAFFLYVYSGRVYPQMNETKDLGMSVRCVTDKLWLRRR
jgi:uncharacterized protein (TIGR02145 family)